MAICAAMQPIRQLVHLISVLSGVINDAFRLLILGLRSRAALQAENLFLRKQLAYYIERETKPRVASDATRLTLVLLSRLIAWPGALAMVKPETFIRWQKKGFRLFWKWKSRPRGRPRLPVRLRDVITEMARNNPTWGEERIADELLLKLGIRVSPRTVRRYMPENRGKGRAVSSQRWMTFVRNHAKGIVACDFFVSVTATFRLLYVFVALDIRSRRIIHVNVTAHPTADWTLQQFREFITGDEPYRFVLHDRDSIYSRELDAALTSMGVRVLKTPFRAPQANAFCERVIGTIRRECLDFLIPFNERHLKRVLTEWVAHYNQGRPHSSLGPGIPDPSPRHKSIKPCGHHIPIDQRVVAKPILGGLHHEYRLEKKAA